MYTYISIFYASILSMALMLYLKALEVKTGRVSIVSRMGRGTDHIFTAIHAKIQRMISYINRKTFVALLQWIAYHVLLRIRKVYVELKHRALQNPHGKRLIDAVRGRADIRRHGASFYLRRISEN
ncbi:MAG: hypothetical protein M1459_00490 [Patescibacteria group bacterium]|nr:hypothetical protein [Patescibacteria group bacterium]